MSKWSRVEDLLVSGEFTEFKTLLEKFCWGLRMDDGSVLNCADLLQRIKGDIETFWAPDLNTKGFKIKTLKKSLKEVKNGLREPDDLIGLIRKANPKDLFPQFDEILFKFDFLKTASRETKIIELSRFIENLSGKGKNKKPNFSTNMWAIFFNFFSYIDGGSSNSRTVRGRITKEEIFREFYWLLTECDEKDIKTEEKIFKFYKSLKRAKIEEEKIQYDIKREEWEEEILLKRNGKT